MCACLGCLPTPTISSLILWTPAGGLQYNSDSKYLELAQTPHVKAQSFDRPPISDTNPKPGRPILLTNHKWDPMIPLLRFDNSLELLTELSETLTYIYQFMIKGTTQEQ